MLKLEESEAGVRVEIRDDGRGMDEVELRLALDPFHSDGKKHAKRRVGLGLPFLVQGVEQAGGEFAIESKRGEGSSVRFRFPAENPDRPPLGDLPELFLVLLTLRGAKEMLIRRTRADGSGYEIRRSELAEALGGLERADSLALLREYLVSQEDDTTE